MAAGVEGASWNAIEEHWDIRRYLALRKYWEDHAPPVALTVAGLAGHKPAAKPSMANDASADGPTRLASPEDIRRMVAMINGR